MRFKELEELCKKKICIWGYGVYGKTYAYLALKCARIAIVCYCDNNYLKGAAFQGIPLICKEELFSKKDLFVVIAIKSMEQQNAVASELSKKGINCTVFDQRSFSELCESIMEANDEQLFKKYADIIDDKRFLGYMYKFKTGQEINFDRPRSFNEKIQYLKIFDHKDEYTNLVDKFEVKSIASIIIGEEHIIATLGVWDSFDEIDFDGLPDKFILKCTHDSGSAVICSDKDQFDITSAKAKLDRAMKTNFFWASREYPYKNVSPQIIAEELLENDDGSELKDYKVFAFNGEPRIIQIDYNRFSNHTRAMYSTDWEYLGFSTEYPLHSEIESKPEELSEILDCTRRLAAGIPHVRVDYYIVNKKVYFGEMTFYHGSGYELFSNETWNIKMGKLIELY